jgi:uncharacterized membrane protein
MAPLLVAVFDDETGARGGGGILRALHAEGTLTLYAMATIARESKGAGLVIRQPLEPSAAATAPAVGAAIGALVTLLGGPMTAATRSITSGLVSAVWDLDEAGLDATFLDRISRHLRAGSGAVIAEVEEDRQWPLDADMLAHGGRLFRHRLASSLLEERMMRELTALRDEWYCFSRETVGEARAGAGTAVRRDRLRELRQILDRTRTRARALRREVMAKVTVIRAQAAALEGEARQAVEHRAASVMTSFHARAARLDDVADSMVLPRAKRQMPKAFGDGKAIG